jgi:outer membrane protein TolC
VHLTSELDSPEPGADPVVDPSMLAKRPALAAAREAVDMREGQVRVAKGAFLPSVGFQMNYGRMIYPTDAFKLQGDWRTDWSASVGVQIPIFSGFQRKAELEKARVELEQAQLQLSQANKAVQLEYEQARGERERTRLEIDARRRTVEQAERVHNLTTLRYERGLATQIDVSDARLALLQARTNLAQALSDYHIADAKLMRALGGSKALSRPAPRGKGEQDGAGRDGQGAGQR